ncbi:hypothetical protein F511_37536 [Dorcoceras hygrometricum]|uniref:Uncharacterized protein n=1 Tax=Dorcoceras hygrometricum TaxID=472368 RepID=A0A2Z7BFH4_9LAMI|nr:hypothetical protein F511_37536 [Dorcoceras hygrometricum]
MMAEEKKSVWADSDSEESSSGTSSSSESEDGVQCLMTDDIEEEVKAEKVSDATSAELISSSNMQAALSKLVIENEELRNKSEEILSENQRLAGIIRSWTRSSLSLQQLHGAINPSDDRTGQGYNSDESSTTETSSVASQNP